MSTPAFTTKDLDLWALWEQGADVPVDYDDATEPIESAWAHFPAGTPRLDVWHWFDQQFSYGLGRMIELMQPEVTTTYNLALKLWVHDVENPPKQIGMFGQDMSEDWGDKIQKKTEKQNRLF